MMSSTQSPPIAGRVAGTMSPVRVDELIVGRTVAHPIYDQRGLLLVAEGLTVTPEIKRNLLARAGEVIVMHPSDVQAATRSDPPYPFEGEVVLETEATRKLDAIIEVGYFPLENRGPAVRDSLTRSGNRPYDAAQRRRLGEQHEQNAEILASTVRQAFDSGDADGGALVAMAGAYLSEMVKDIDNVLTSAPPGQQDTPSSWIEVSLLSMALGVEMGLDADHVRDLGACALLHDWGMLRVPEEIRNAPYRLSPSDRVAITKHPIYTVEMLAKMSRIPRIAPIVVYQVHERPNGQGYLRGRTGSYIHPLAKIIHVADSFTSLASPRPYRPPLMRYSAIECLVRQAGEQAVDPAVVRALLRIQSLFPLGSLVGLSDGSEAVVLRPNGDAFTKPIVQRVRDADGQQADPLDEANLIDLLHSPLTICRALPTPGRGEICLDEETLKVH